MVVKLDANEPEKSWPETATRQNMFRRIDRQPDDIAE
jgi:hypothetical protein